MKKNIEAFTLVELIVVITILSILSTLGFVMYTDYLRSVRDGSRLQQISSLNNALNLLETKQAIPLPSDQVYLEYDGVGIGYQGSLGVENLDKIRYSDGGRDPKTKEYFPYYVSANRKYFQLMTYLEENTLNDENTSQISTGEGEYSSLFPYTIGSELGMLTDTSFTPIYKIVTSTLDLASYSGSLISFGSESGSELLSATEFALLIPEGSCKRLKQLNPAAESNYYRLNLGDKQVTVYCDMEIDGGGWMLVVRSGIGSGNFGWLTKDGDNRDIEAKYSFGPDIQKFHINEMLLTIHTIESQGIDIKTAIKIGVDSQFIAQEFATIGSNNLRERESCTYLFGVGTHDPCLDSTEFLYYGAFHKVFYHFSNMESQPQYLRSRLVPNGWLGKIAGSPFYGSYGHAKSGMIFIR